MHRIIIDRPVGLPEDGLMLGNGDLSLAVFQQPGAIVFRLGKGDFWDRRIDLSRNPKPAHISELREAVEKYGVRCSGVTLKPESQIDNPRLAELCRPMPSARTMTPTPKPAAEILLHYPADPPGFSLRQTLEIERGRIVILCRWENGMRLELRAVIHPDRNEFSLRWKMSGWTRENRYGGNFYGLPVAYPVWAALWREADPDHGEFRRKHYLRSRTDFYAGCDDSTFPPLPHPECLPGTDGAFPVLSQKGSDSVLNIRLSGPECTFETRYDVVHVLPPESALEGEFSAVVSMDSMPEPPSGYAVCEAAALDSAKRFWARSKIHLADRSFENLWYAVLHAKRCVLKAGKIPPGLFLPATIDHFSLWNGDYHFNYNYQSMFLGDYEANHFDTGDAYFTGIEHHLELGCRIARESYDSPEGCFVQLSGFPFPIPQDQMGGLPLGRMAYMTGWVAAYYFRRWELSHDRAFLGHSAYPVLKRIAAFYSDFLTCDENGVWHAFPSNQGEADFSRAGTLDQPQVMWHAEYALRCAAAAARELKADSVPAAHWLEIADHLAVRYPCRKDLAAEFAGFDGGASDGENPDFLEPGSRFYDWYAGQTPYKLLTLLYQGLWNAEKNFDLLRHAVLRWETPNGIPRAVSLATHGSFGVWSESLGFGACVSAMLLQSREGVICLFPAWPKKLDASFENLRAAGGFLVSARLRSGRVEKIRIASGNGAEACRCRTPDGREFEVPVRHSA